MPVLNMEVPINTEPIIEAKPSHAGKACPYMTSSRNG